MIAAHHASSTLQYHKRNHFLAYIVYSTFMAIHLLIDVYHVGPLRTLLITRLLMSRSVLLQIFMDGVHE